LKDWLGYFSDLLQEPLSSIRHMTGGDISQAFAVEGPAQSYFIKIHAGKQASAMFDAEYDGLIELGQCESVLVPHIVKKGIVQQRAFIIMDFIAATPAQDLFWENLAVSIASLHRQTSDRFGLSYPNFIGSLAQSNLWQNEWSGFYLSQRLLPQTQMAIDEGLLNQYDLKSILSLGKRLDDLCPIESSSLIHGDLWSGNWICGPDQKAYLIDPSISYNHREMDLAMACLFGGFHQRFFDCYHSQFPLSPGFSDRVDIYQLYYLLVHLNLFGRSYLSSVQDILQKYS